MDMLRATARSSKWVQLATLTLVYVVGELSHFLLGVVTTPMSQELHYGDYGCLANPELGTEDLQPPSGQLQCYTGNSSETCAALWVSPSTNTSGCVWDYSGLGMQYQLLAGPAFVAVFTLVGIPMGFMADVFNRKIVLTCCMILLTAALTLMGAANRYWHLVVLRMMVAAGESSFAPAASSIISDMFTQSIRAFALGVFNWGIYLGYGLSYIIGNYVTKADILGMGWRWSYYISGLLGAVTILLLIVVVREPERNAMTLHREEAGHEDGDKFSQLAETASTVSGDRDSVSTCERRDFEIQDPVSTSEKEGGKIASGENPPNVPSGQLATDFCKAVTTPSLILLCVAASVRHTGGFTWAYNTQLYFQTYYPDFPVGAWVSVVSIVGGTIGVAAGGFVSDKMAGRIGPRARLYVLAGSQFLAAPFAAGALYLAPPAAMFSLLGAYLFAETWFGILFAVLLAVVPSSVKSSALAFFLFVMNNIGGNAPMLIEPLRAAIGYRQALTVLYPGCFLLSSVLFLFTSFFVPDADRSESEPTVKGPEELPRQQPEPQTIIHQNGSASTGGHDNVLAVPT